MSRIAARLGSSRSTNSECRRLDTEASASSAAVICSEYGIDACTLACALAMREVAIISWALVIFCVERTDFTRCRNTLTCAAMASPPSGSHEAGLDPDADG